MPRDAKAAHSAATWLPPKIVVSACRTAFRMSSIVGSSGESIIPSVTIASVTAEPTTPRICQSVWAQISPSACTSGMPRMFAMSPYV